MVDDCIYYKFCGSKYIFLVLYVDDILLNNNDIDLLHETKSEIALEWGWIRQSNKSENLIAGKRESRRKKDEHNDLRSLDSQQS